MSKYVDTEYIKAVMLNDRLMQGNAEFTLYARCIECKRKQIKLKTEQTERSSE